MYLDEEGNPSDNTIIASHTMLHHDYDDYIDDELVLDILDVVMDNPYNDSEGLDTNFDIDYELDIESHEVQDQYDMDM